MKISFTRITLFFLFCFHAQYAVSQSEVFVPQGKPIVKVFSDFSTQISQGKAQSGFQLSRAYLGYNYRFSQNISGQVVLDVANSAGLQPSSFTTFFKNAYAKYSTEAFTASFGMIGTTAFDLSEDIWGKRYLYKSLQDEYGFSSSADLGATISYQFVDQLSADISVFNGEGYKKVQMDSVFQFAMGITVQPINHFYLRLYGDYMQGAAVQNTLGAFLGYQSSKASAGIDYSHQRGNGMLSGYDFEGYSVFGTYILSEKFSVFARFDHLQSAQIGASSWNVSDGELYMAGLEYSPIKGIKITPNLRLLDYAVGSAASHIFVNFEMSW
jgi:hypothetical protein